MSGRETLPPAAGASTLLAVSAELGYRRVGSSSEATKGDAGW
jgi:hypothetical protein